MQLRALIALFAGMLCASVAHGALVLTLDQPVQFAVPGTIVEFTGSITNTGPESLGLIRVEFTPPVVPPPFETGIPLVLLFLFKPVPGQQYTGVVFAVQIDRAATPGQVMRTLVTIEDPGGRVSPSNGIEVQLTAVPEPASLVLAGFGLGSLAFARRVRR